MEEFERIITLDPDNSRAHYYLGTEALLAGDLPRAIGLLEKALTLNPDQKDGQFNLGKAYGRAQRFEDAAKYLAEARRQDPGNSQTAYWEAFYLLKAEAYSQADALLKESTKTYAGDSTLKFLAARFWATCPREEWRDGQEALNLAMSVSDPKSRLQREIIAAMAEAELNRFESAITHQQRALEMPLAKTSVPLRQGLNRLLAEYRAGKPCREIFWFENLPR